MSNGEVGGFLGEILGFFSVGTVSVEVDLRVRGVEVAEPVLEGLAFDLPLEGVEVKTSLSLSEKLSCVSASEKSDPAAESVSASEVEGEDCARVRFVVLFGVAREGVLLVEAEVEAEGARRRRE